MSNKVTESVDITFAGETDMGDEVVDTMTGTLRYPGLGNSKIQALLG
ncbi:21611_t:CDS:2, partial [Gigaspora rosea]